MALLSLPFSFASALMALLLSEEKNDWKTLASPQQRLPLQLRKNDGDRDQDVFCMTNSLATDVSEIGVRCSRTHTLSGITSVEEVRLYCAMVYRSACWYRPVRESTR